MRINRPVSGPFHYFTSFKYFKYVSLIFAIPLVITANFKSIGRPCQFIFLRFYLYLSSVLQVTVTFMVLVRKMVLAKTLTLGPSTTSTFFKDL